MLYTLGWRGNESTATVHLLRVDQKTLQLTGDWDTGIGTGAAEVTQVDSTQVFFEPTVGPIAVIADSPFGGGSVRTRVLAMRSSRLMSLADVTDSGLRASTGNGMLYLYGGSGGPHVTQIDLLSGTQSDYPYTAPDGTQVLAVLPSPLAPRLVG